jgi:hypothetical protein
MVSNLRAGEYTLAVKESTVGSLEPPVPVKTILDIFPNPSSGSFTIISGSEEEAEIRIYSDSGTLVKAFAVEAGQEMINWLPDGLAAGNYLVALYRENYSAPEVRKVFYLP